MPTALRGHFWERRVTVGVHRDKLLHAAGTVVNILGDAVVGIAGPRLIGGIEVVDVPVDVTLPIYAPAPFEFAL
jgi:hypothetical protein